MTGVLESAALDLLFVLLVLVGVLKMVEWALDFVIFALSRIVAELERRNGA